MQDVRVRTWLRDSDVSAEVLESLRELNHRFLDLATQPRDWGAARPWLPGAVSAQVAPLSAAQKSAAASCPYALFDLRFHDDRHWRTRLRGADPPSVAEELGVDAPTLEFVHLALFFAWHVAATTKLAAQLLLGMHEATIAAFRGATIDCLPALASTEAAHLTARWNDCGAYWTALARTASRPNQANLRRIQLYGLQLAAAARLA